jgi:hypothetical protein
MKEYKSTPKKCADTVNEPAVAYEIAPPTQYLGAMQEVKIPRDENGRPIGHTLSEFSEKLLDKLSEAYGVDFRKL